MLYSYIPQKYDPRENGTLFEDRLPHIISVPYTKWWCHSHSGRWHGHHTGVTDGSKLENTKVERLLVSLYSYQVSLQSINLFKIH